MKLGHVVFVAMVSLLLLLGAAAQETKNGPSPRPAVISGRVIDQGRILVGQNRDWWSVGNPELLKTHEGELVTVQYRVAEGGKIQVLSLRKMREEPRYSSNYGDAAFRR